MKVLTTYKFENITIVIDKDSDPENVKMVMKVLKKIAKAGGK